MITRFQTIFICALVAACGRSSERPANTDSSRPGESSLSSRPVAGIGSKAEVASLCPRTGKWALCSVEKRLRQSGFVVSPVRGDPPHRAGFSVAPAVYKLGRSRLELFIYADEAGVARDVAKLDTVAVAPRGSAGNWGGMPTFVRAGNLVAVFLADNPTHVDRLTLALTAGAPQP